MSAREEEMSKLRRHSPLLRRLFWNPFLLLAVPFMNAPVINATEDPAVLSRLTTPIEVQFEGAQTSSGTGFFFQVLAPPDPSKPEPQWRAIQAVFVITNRHVVSPERFAAWKKLTFFLRRLNGSAVEW